MTTTTPVTSTQVSPPPSSSASAAPAATSTTANGTDSTGTLNFTQNFDTFLTLLTTQLQNQDPLSPVDTDQFTQELVSFSQVEQQLKTNDELSTMIAGQASSQAISALPMVGRQIQYTGNSTTLQNGQSTFSYTLPSNAATATAVLTDASGATVFSQAVDPSAGTHSITWNGVDSTGVQRPDGGTYTLNILALDSQNAQITATTTATGTVTGVSVNNNVATFDVNGVQVPMNQLVNIVNNATTTN